MLVESLILAIACGIQAYIIRKIDNVEARLDRLEIELRIAIERMPRRKTDYKED